MRLRWTDKALSDLDRLTAFLAPVNPGVAARVALMLVEAPERLLDNPRLGRRLPGYPTREIRRLLAGDSEIRHAVL